MNSKDLEKKKAREKVLAEDRRKILGLPPEHAVEAVLGYPYPVTLVQSMAEEDLYLLIHTIGPDDALQLLGMASNEQWEYFLDMEVWSKDRLDPQRMTEWLARLLKADPDRFTHWIVHQQRDSFEYYLFRHLQVHVREYEEDPAEISDGFFSEDQVHYIRFRPYAGEDLKNKELQEQRDQFLTDLLKRISVYDFSTYQGLLLESSTLIPAEAEEDLLRLRNLRLAEKGFLPHEEAVGVYQPLTVADLLIRRRKPETVGGRAVDGYPLVIDPAQTSDAEDLFTQTLARIRDEDTLHRLQIEFAGLCNQVIAADQLKVREKKILTQTVTKVRRYIGIGLEKIDAQSDSQDPHRNANMIQNYLLTDIFRLGYGCVLKMKWRAEKWRQASWFNRVGLTPAFWGEAWLGALGGLLIKKPMYYDNYVSGVLYREFATLAEVTATEKILGQIIAMDDLFSLMEVEIPELEEETFLAYQNVLLTLWANHQMAGATDQKAPQPIPVTQFRQFFTPLWDDGPTPRKIKDGVREEFLYWLSKTSGIATMDLIDRLGQTLQALFEQIENELGSIAPNKIDPRYILLFLLK